MNLREYIEKKSINVTEFAETVGVSSRQRMVHLIRGFRTIPLDVAKRIEQVTEGQVSRLEMLYPEEYVNEG